VLPLSGEGFSVRVSALQAFSSHVASIPFPFRRAIALASAGQQSRVKTVGSGTVEKAKLDYIQRGILGHIGCPPFSESFPDETSG
jgi:hypothetical protein